jgi:hypothetical protein
MATVRTNAAPVNPSRLPFRPLLTVPQASYWRDECHALHVLLSGKRATTSYEVIPLSTDIGGAAFRWFKRGGESYDVLCNGHDSSCSCKGWAYTGGCKHLEITFALLTLGVLETAPASAGGECDDEDAA